MDILLDTCTFLWAHLESNRLSTVAKQVFRNKEHTLYLSAISVWEIMVKHKLGSLQFDESPQDFITRCQEINQIASLDLQPADVFYLDTLPSLHRDPFDRMLICQALNKGLIIMTPDSHIRTYPIRTIW